MIINTLVILGRNHRHDGLAICKAKNGNFLAYHKLLNNHTAASSTKGLIAHDFINSPQSLLQSHGYNNTLACSQAISLDNDRSTFLTDILLGCLSLSKYLVLGSRDIVLLHEILGKGLGALNLCCCLYRAKSLDTCCIKGIYSTISQWHLWAYYSQLNILLLSQLNQSIIICNGNTINALCQLSHTRVARYCINLVCLDTLSQLPYQCVLTGTTTNYQYIHYLFTCSMR